MDVLTSLGEHKNLLELISRMLTLRLEEVATFFGDSALDDAIAYHDNAKMKKLISSAEDFLFKGFITMIHNGWSDYVKQSIGSEFDLLYKSVFFTKKTEGGNVVRSLAEHVYNSSNKLNLFFNGRPWQVDCRRLYELMIPGEGVEHVEKFKDGVDTLGRMLFRDRSSIEEYEMFQFPKYQRRRLPWCGPQFMLDVGDIIFWRSAVLEDDLNENEWDFSTREQRKVKENEKAVWALLLLLGNCARLLHGFPGANRTLAVKSMFKSSSIRELLHRHDSRAQIRGRALATEMIKLILHPKTVTGSMILSTLSPTRCEDENFRTILATEVKNNVEVFPLSLLDKHYDTYEWKHVLKSKVDETEVGDKSAVRSCANLTGKKKTHKRNTSGLVRNRKK